MTQAPSLAQQIDAVEWAARHFRNARKELQQRGVPDFVSDDIMPVDDALVAAVETLKTMEFAREALN